MDEEGGEKRRRQKNSVVDVGATLLARVNRAAHGNLQYSKGVRRLLGKREHQSGTIASNPNGIVHDGDYRRD